MIVKLSVCIDYVDVSELSKIYVTFYVTGSVEQKNGLIFIVFYIPFSSFTRFFLV